MIRTLTSSALFCLIALAGFIALPSADAAPPALPGGALLSLQVTGGIAAFDSTETHYNNGDWTIDDRFRNLFCEGSSTSDETRDLREAVQLLRPYALDDAVFGKLTCCDQQAFVVTTRQGTVTWFSGSVLPPDVEEAASLIFGNSASCF